MQIDWWTLALQAVNFLVLVWLLQRFLFRPVRRMIETRKTKLEEQLHAAEGKLAEAEAEKTRYTELIAAFDARKEADLKDFQTQLDSERDAAMAKSRNEAEALISAAKEEIMEDRRKAIDANRTDLFGLAKDIASKILEDRATDADLASDLASAMRKLDALPDNQRQRLLKTLSGDAPGVAAVTLKALDKNGQNEITKVLKKHFGSNIHVSFEVDPGLLGGMKINLPQAQLDASWATYLDAAIERLLESGNERQV